MSTFPTTLYPQFGYRSWQEEYKSRATSRAGKHQEKDYWGRTRFMADMSFNLRTDDALTVYGFWKQNRSLAFDFFDYEDDKFFGSAIGTGDGVTTTFTLPAKTVRSQTIYVAGVAKVAGTHYNMSVGSGPLGEDRIIFTGGNIPTGGQVITGDWIGKGRYSCVFVSAPEKESSGRARLGLRVSIMESFI